MGAEKDGQGVSPELDDLSSTLMGQAFDVLAEGVELNVILAVEDAAGNVASYTFADDGPEECLEGARKKVRDLARSCGDAAAKLGAPVRYALAYASRPSRSWTARAKVTTSPGRTQPPPARSRTCWGRVRRSLFSKPLSCLRRIRWS